MIHICKTNQTLFQTVYMHQAKMTSLLTIYVAIASYDLSLVCTFRVCGQILIAPSLFTHFYSPLHPHHNTTIPNLLPPPPKK